MAAYEIRVPGTFIGCFVDVETAKVPTPPGFALPSGEPLRQRWAAIMVGVGRGSQHTITLFDREGGDEAEFLEELGDVGLPMGGTIAYSATRDFDEMILAGRFTNARRPHLPEPTWPAVPDVEWRTWKNLGAIPKPKRDDDCESREVPKLYETGFWMLVAVHLLRDVAELILAAGEPDRICETWCRAILLDYDLAVRQFSE